VALVALGCTGGLGEGSDAGAGAPPSAAASGGHAGGGAGESGAGGSQGGAAGDGGSAGAGGGGDGGAGGAPTLGFGYPVGDGSTYPAGGWSVWQVLSHYWSAYDGRHLAHDISLPGGVAAVGAPVFSVAAGRVLYAKTNASSYRHVVLIEHEVGDGTKVCSFYGHITAPVVVAGQRVARGEAIATVLDWADAVAGGASSNTHLHYVLLDEAYCAFAASTGTAPGSGSGVCGYDSGGDNGLDWTDLAAEPFSYTAVADACGASAFAGGLLSPTQFIEQHHFLAAGP
jgi:murein DD-endopeptidase MepM/ murein hydrolase activator NlpD